MSHRASRQRAKLLRLLYAFTPANAEARIGAIKLLQAGVMSQPLFLEALSHLVILDIHAAAAHARADVEFLDSSPGLDQWLLDLNFYYAAVGLFYARPLYPPPPVVPSQASLGRPSARGRKLTLFLPPPHTPYPHTPPSLLSPSQASLRRPSARGRKLTLFLLPFPPTLHPPTPLSLQASLGRHYARRHCTCSGHYLSPIRRLPYIQSVASQQWRPSQTCNRKSRLHLIGALAGTLLFKLDSSTESRSNYSIKLFATSAPHSAFFRASTILAFSPVLEQFPELIDSFVVAALALSAQHLSALKTGSPLLKISPEHVSPFSLAAARNGGSTAGKIAALNKGGRALNKGMEGAGVRGVLSMSGPILF
ncbi:hypothetical protein T492DRAFT_839877 [Pavlovales sp. CCMP2436]|nr:hypothetical protein T492DRAFT_839877 [Pavlovales sp. CCMP2436]